MKRWALSGLMTAMWVLRVSGQCEGQEPGPVTGVNASDGAYCDYVHVNWNAAARANQYYIYRDSQWIGNTPTTEYDDFVSDGVTHHYDVSPWNECGWGVGSGDDGYAHYFTPPTVSASYYDYCGQVHITWNPVPGETNYQVWRDDSFLGSTSGTNFDDYLGDTPGVPGGGLYKVSGLCGLSFGYGSDYGVALSSPGEATGVNASDGTCCGYVHVTWNWPVMAEGFQVERDGSCVGSTADTCYDDYPGDTSGHYYVIVATNACGVTSSQPAYGYAGAGEVCAPTITVQPQSQTVAVGSNAVFMVAATGPTPLSYQWQFNSTNLSGATEATLTLTNVQPAQSGIYSVVVSNSFGSVTSAPASLMVNAVWLEIALASSNAVQLILHGEAGKRYELQASTDLVNWSGLTLLNTPAGLATFTNATPGQATRFFRARLTSGDEVWFESVNLEPPGQLKLTFHSGPGKQCEIWTSTNLTQWSLLRTVTNDTGTVVFTDPMTNRPCCFYRLRQLP